MTLTEKYEYLNVFKPYVVLFLNSVYNKKGEPIIIDYMENYLSPNDHEEFRKIILSQHKSLININHSLIELTKTNIETYKLFFNKK